jgi:hypothetical protein
MLMLWICYATAHRYLTQRLCLPIHQKPRVFRKHCVDISAAGRLICIGSLCGIASEPLSPAALLFSSLGIEKHHFHRRTAAVSLDRAIWPGATTSTLVSPLPPRTFCILFFGAQIETPAKHRVSTITTANAG